MKSLLGGGTRARGLTVFISQEADTQISAPRLDRVMWTRFTLSLETTQTKQTTNTWNPARSKYMELGFLFIFFWCWSKNRGLCNCEVSIQPLSYILSKSMIFQDIRYHAVKDTGPWREKNKLDESWTHSSQLPAGFPGMCRERRSQ